MNPTAYEVFKASDVAAALEDDELAQLQSIAAKIKAFREKRGRKPLECLVIEDDWPGYELVQAILDAGPVFKTPKDLEDHVVKILAIKLIQTRAVLNDALMADHIASLPPRQWIRRVKLARDATL